MIKHTFALCVVAIVLIGCTTNNTKRITINKNAVISDYKVAITGYNLNKKCREYGSRESHLNASDSKEYEWHITNINLMMVKIVNGVKNIQNNAGKEFKKYNCRDANTRAMIQKGFTRARTLNSQLTGKFYSESSSGYELSEYQYFLSMSGVRLLRRCDFASNDLLSLVNHEASLTEKQFFNKYPEARVTLKNNIKKWEAKADSSDCPVDKISFVTNLISQLQDLRQNLR